jgi:NhaP-type Na+/H+ or K+/H+ antiporter
LAFSCFSTAQLIGGSGFIACFAGGILYGSIHKKNKGELLVAAEGIADTLSLITWFIFGSYIIAKYLPHFSWQVVIYTLLSLTAVRMVPVFISLINSGVSTKDKLFIGWFGPRGLASIVFGIIILAVNLPNEGEIILTVVCTILVSVVAHGLTANPLINWLNASSKNNKSVEK